MNISNVLFFMLVYFILHHLILHNTHYDEDTSANLRLTLVQM